MSDSILDSVHTLTHWMNGNGKPGAAATIADHEKRITKNEESIGCHDSELRKIEIHHITEEQTIINAVHKAMAARGKSKEGLIRAYGPYVASISALLSPVVVILVSKLVGA